MTSPRVENVIVDDVRRQLEVRWSSAVMSANYDDVTLTSRYPYTWLRDCCQCTQCFNGESVSYKTTFDDFHIDCCPKNIEVVNEGVRITWSNGHVSEYTCELLKRTQFAEQPPKLSGPKLQLWGSEFKIPRFSFAQVMADDIALYQWIETLWKTGLCLLTGAPEATCQLQEINRRVGFCRMTQYGETFEVKTKSTPSNVAYTADKLGMHMDNGCFRNIPGVQMLHCIKQTQSNGGHNQFSDGFQAADKLRTLYPDYFRLLTSVPVDFYDAGSDFVSFDHRGTHHTIQLDEDGEQIAEIAFSNQTRNKLNLHRTVAVNDVDTFYRALRTFYDLLYHPDNLVEYKLTEGDIVCFHNYRVLHARRAYEPSSGNDDVERYLEGTYIDWDEMLSQARVIQRQLNIDLAGDDPDLAKTYIYCERRIELGDSLNTK